MIKYLLDADTFSQMVKGIHPGIVERMGSLPTDEAALSVITRGEIQYGLELSPIRAAWRKRLDLLLSAFATLGLDAVAALHYAQLRAHLSRRGTPIGPNDLWIAAHARAANLILVTHNTREFSRVPRLKLENWME